MELLRISSTCLEMARFSRNLEIGHKTFCSQSSVCFMAFKLVSFIIWLFSGKRPKQEQADVPDATDGASFWESCCRPLLTSKAHPSLRGNCCLAKPLRVSNLRGRKPARRRGRRRVGSLGLLGLLELLAPLGPLGPLWGILRPSWSVKVIFVVSTWMPKNSSDILSVNANCKTPSQGS